MIVSEHIVHLRPPAAPGMGIGDNLAYANWTHFGQVQGTPGVGLGFCSCNASVAIESHDFYTRAFNGQFSVMHGNSQIFRGLDPANPVPDQPDHMFASSAAGEHAEQIAVQVMIGSAAEGVNPWMYDNLCHVYIDLGPCDGCRAWLEAHSLRFALYYVVPYEDADSGTLDRIHRANRRHFKNFGMTE